MRIASVAIDPAKTRAPARAACDELGAAAARTATAPTATRTTASATPAAASSSTDTKADATPSSSASRTPGRCPSTASPRQSGSRPRAVTGTRSRAASPASAADNVTPTAVPATALVDAAGRTRSHDAASSTASGNSRTAAVGSSGDQPDATRTPIDAATSTRPGDCANTRSRRPTNTAETTVAHVTRPKDKLDQSGSMFSVAVDTATNSARRLSSATLRVVPDRTTAATVRSAVVSSSTRTSNATVDP
mmetsp:Transcript_12789/g.40401  ORF Transcript_12789/g.40401 Transcript_12789/m.40401 type:complete len:249 (+) Transcript_12789:188-934(+)